MTLHPDPEYQPIPVKAIIPRSLGTRSQRINPWIPSSQPAATVCRSDSGYELKEAAIRPTQQKYRVLTGKERGRHFGLIRVDPERPCPTIQKSQTWTPVKSGHKPGQTWQTWTPVKSGHKPGQTWTSVDQS